VELKQIQKPIQIRNNESNKDQSISQVQEVIVEQSDSVKQQTSESYNDENQ